MRWTVLSTPVGDLSVATDGAGICRVQFGRCSGPPARPDDALLATAATQLEEYFAGRRTGFELPLADVYGSTFERAVWAELAAIPYGEMRTYGEVAAAVGDKLAARAVGTACNRNPLPILLPCHRVVGAGGKLVGFGGGLARKRVLLELEAGRTGDARLRSVDDGTAAGYPAAVSRETFGYPRRTVSDRPRPG